MRISTFFYTLKQGIVNIFRNKWFSLASIATISASLFILGLFYAVILNFQNIVHTAEEGVSVTIFFQEGTTEERMKEIGAQIETRDDVTRVEFTSAEEAWEYYKENFIPEEYADGFPEGDNPLENCASYEIFMDDVSHQAELVAYLETIPEIREINESALAATTLTGVNALVAYVSAGIIIILVLVSMFLINNTVTIGISVRKEEINIMKYIGATDFFVRAPFVIEGILIGILGCILPLAGIYVMYNNVLEFINNRFSILSGLLQFLPVNEVYRTLVPVVVVIGVGIGFLGSFFTVRKHLHV
ncbi:MAG TPA: permease-like cell division protein FtsX [Candidatus Eisenbergiella merdipullorum]|uniref:Cell division protein FtsX n=1 Tax=Candidatus Eisenbergiella merdipullorum TaxID=2838553 RepID=A0A9D2L1R8_9FIRM|nr:permease-like cell division protein FtsX [Candidatus Eisenbergiella merdipullorum]